MLKLPQTMGMPGEFTTGGNYYCLPCPGVTACLSPHWTKDQYTLYFWVAPELGSGPGKTLAEHGVDDLITALALIHHFIATHTHTSGGNHHDEA